VSITLPHPAPEADALTAYLERFAPKAWLETLEAMQQPGATAALDPISAQIGHEKTIDVAVESLDDKRLRVWGAIKAKRDYLSDTGGYPVDVDGVTRWFHSDAKSKTQQLGLVLMGASVPAVPWKTLGGAKVPMSQALASAIFAAAAAQDMAIFAAAETHRAAMEAAADPDAYDFAGGWPVVFGA
jgi:hypothetical protein